MAIGAGHPIEDIKPPEQSAVQSVPAASVVENQVVKEKAPKKENAFWAKIRNFITYGGLVYEISRTVIVLVLVVVFIHLYIATIFVVSGPSMNPTFATDQFTIVNRVEYYFHQPERGDVVSVKFPGNPRIKYIKRVIGLPNEQIQTRLGRVYIFNKEFPDGKILDEPYLPKEFKTEPDGVWKLGPDEFFIIGDNRPNSSDSRTWGPLPRDYVIGRVTLVFFPFDAAKIVAPQIYNIGKKVLSLIGNVIF